MDADILWNGPYKIIETSVALKTKSIINEGLMFLLNKVHQNYQMINKRIETNHKQIFKNEDKRIKLQKQRVRDQITSSPSSSSIISPGKMRKYVK